MKLFSLIILSSLCCLTTLLSAQREIEQPVPDFTKGGQIDDRHDWNLGPTGLRGWMWGWKLQTTKADQIFITKVDKGSPAHGLFQEGDMIPRLKKLE